MCGLVLGTKTCLEEGLWLGLLLMIIVIQGLSPSEAQQMRWIEILRELGIKALPLLSPQWWSLTLLLATAGQCSFALLISQMHKVLVVAQGLPHSKPHAVGQGAYGDSSSFWAALLTLSFQNGEITTDDVRNPDLSETWTWSKTPLSTQPLLHFCEGLGRAVIL